MAKKDIEVRIVEIEQQRAKLEAERKQLLARKTEVDRKAATRRKIILGGIVISDDRLKGIVLPTLDARLKQQRDRDLFGLPDRSKQAPDDVSTNGSGR